MNNYIFLYKETNTDDRDCVKYVDMKDLQSNHTCIDEKFNIHGACFSASLREEDIDFNNIKTVLTIDELKTLCNPKGKDILHIIQKLESCDNEKLFEEIVEEEEEFLKEEYGLSESDIETIFDEYYLGYKDRGIVGCMYDNTSDLGYETALSFGYIDTNNIVTLTYFDYERFGEDLLNDEEYIELEDGRVVSLNY